MTLCSKPATPIGQDADVAPPTDRPCPKEGLIDARHSVESDMYR